jgi:hypothetical protein
MPVLWSSLPPSELARGRVRYFRILNASEDSSVIMPSRVMLRVIHPDKTYVLQATKV